MNNLPVFAINMASASEMSNSVLRTMSEDMNAKQRVLLRLDTGGTQPVVVKRVGTVRVPPPNKTVNQTSRSPAVEKSTGTSDISGVLHRLEAKINDMERQIKQQQSAKNYGSPGRRMDAEWLEDLENDSTTATTLSPALGARRGGVDPGKHLKSGFDIVNQTTSVVTEKWPHGFCDKIRNYTNIKPDELDIQAFFYGYCEILQTVLGDPVELYGRIMHAKQVLKHSMHNGWESARDFHYLVLRDLEIGNLSWGDLQSMQILSLSSAEGVKKTAPKKRYDTPYDSANRGNQNLKQNKFASIFCYMYNNVDAGCKFEKQGQCKKVHACSKCGENGFVINHRAAFECSRK